MGVEKHNGLHINATIGRTIPLTTLERTFEPGKMYAITGVNGAGKTTLLLTLAGHLEPFDGTVSLNGVPPGDVTNSGRINHIDDPIFLPDLSLGEHIALIERKAKVDLTEQLEPWQLDELAALPPSYLSSGQRQRAYLATQLYLPATVLIMDEPERHLDAAWQAFLAEELRAIAETGVTIIIATHSEDMLWACDERVLL